MIDQNNLYISLCYNIFMKHRTSFTEKEKQEVDIKNQENKKQINIILEKEEKDDDSNNFPLVYKYPIQKFLQSNSYVLLSDILIQLRKLIYQEYFDCSISFYHQQKKAYVFSFFISKTVTEKQLERQSKYKKRIPLQAFELKKQQYNCKLRFRKKCKSQLQLLKQQQQRKYIAQQESRKGVKQKQKSVAEVIEKVALWRKLYTGFQDEKDEVVHYELEDAANHVGVIKKTLDDYLLQIRNGKRYGFNFQKRKNEKIGQLRGFVKQKRADKK